MARLNRAHIGMEMDTLKFGKAVRKFARKSERINISLARALFMDLLRLVILRTPVKDGRARGGWGAGVEGNGLPPGAIGGKGPAYEEGRARSTYTEKVTRTKIRLAVENGVEYIEALEYGHSRQAPFGMLRISMRELEARLGGRKLPKKIRNMYERTWATLGLAPGTQLTAGVQRIAADDHGLDFRKRVSW